MDKLRTMPRSPQPSPVVIHNRLPMAGWVFMTIWLSMLGLFTWLFFRDGGFHQFDIEIELAILALFWLFGMAGAGYLLNLPVTRLSFTGKDATLREIKPWAIRDQALTTRDLASLTFRDGRDSDGDPYFALVMRLPGDRWVTVSEGKDKPELEALSRRLQV